MFLNLILVYSILFPMFSLRKRLIARSRNEELSASHLVSGGVSELADEHDLGSCAERRGGSSPPFPTTMNSIKRKLLLPGFV